MSIVVHHLEKSRSHRILWFLEEIGAEHEVCTYRRDRSFRAPAALRDVHPRGRAPVVVWDGRVLAESGAILETLAEALAPGLIPARDSDDFRHHRFFLHYAEGSLMSPLLVALIMDKVAKAPVPLWGRLVGRGVRKAVNRSYTQPELDNHLRFLEDHLQRHAWFAGSSFGIADIQMSYPLIAAAQRISVPFPTPAVNAWTHRVQGRDAFQRAVTTGGPLY